MRPLALLLLSCIFVSGTRARCAESSASVRVAILVADAEKLFRQGKPRDAVALYDRAAAKAFGEGATGRAFELSRIAAAVLQSLGEQAEAGGRLRRLALANAAHPQAASTHRSAIVCLAQASGESPDAALAYGEAIDEFLDQWPADPAAREVRWWRARWLVAQGDWQAAINHLTAYQPADPEHGQAMRLLGQAVLGRLAQLRAEGEQPHQTKKLVLLVTRRLQPLVTGADNQWPQQWSARQRHVALSLAKMHMAYRDSGPEYPYRLLAAAVTGEPTPSEAWKILALPPLIEASINANQFEHAIAWSQQVPLAARDSVKPLVRKLEGRAAQGDQAESIGRVLLALAQRLEQPSPPAWLRRAHAAGLVAVGRHAEALGLLRPLAEQLPDDAAVRRLYAAALSQQSSEEALLDAVKLYADIEAREKPGGDAWRQARLSRIELLLATGQRTKAQKLMKLTQALYSPPTKKSLVERQAELRAKLN